MSGPTSASTQVSEIDAARKAGVPAWPTFPSLDQYGLSLAADYQVLYQHATESPGEEDAASGVARFYGVWTPSKEKVVGASSIVFKVEHRHRIAAGITPQSLGAEIGYAGLTAVPWSDAGFLFTNLYWTGGIDDNRFGFAVGLVDVTDYIDPYALMNPWMDFNNYAFTTNPTIAIPNQGAGAALRWTVMHNYYILAGIADANGDPHDPGSSLEGFFRDHEYFTHLEVGWAGSWARRSLDNAHVHIWHKDEREDAGIDEGWGLAISWSRQFDDRWSPFFRAGYSDGGGAVLDRMVSTGLGCRVNARGDFAGVGASWGRAPDQSSGGSTTTQFTLETYYRWQPIPHLSLVPDIQYIFHPAYDTDVDRLWVLGLRLRLTF